MYKSGQSQEFPGGPVVRTPNSQLLMLRAQVQPLVRELRSHKQKKKKKEKKNPTAKTKIRPAPSVVNTHSSSFALQINNELFM